MIKFFNKKNKSDKKATLVTDETIRTILILIAFVILILLLGTIGYYAIIKEKTCHDSIVMRSSVNYGIFSTAKIVPLKCDTQRICLTMSGNNCEVLGKPSKDNIIDKTKINSDPDKAKQEVLNKISNALVACQSTLGEGQLMFMPKSKWTTRYCLICSRIVFDNMTAEEVPSITYSELYQYMNYKTTSDGKSYLEYLYPGWNNWHNAKFVFDELKQSPDAPADIKNLRYEDWKIDLTKENGYVIIGQITPMGHINKWGPTVGVGFVAGVVAMTGFGAPLSVAILASGASGYAMSYTAPDKDYAYVAPMLYPAEAKSLQDLQCNSFETAP